MCLINLINLRYIRKEVEDKIDRTLGKVILGEETGFIVENAVVTIVEDIEEVEVILEEVVFKEGLIHLFRRNDDRDRNREDRRTWRQSRLRERGMRARSESSSRSSSRTSTNRNRVRCFKCREYDHFANECPNLVPRF